MDYTKFSEKDRIIKAKIDLNKSRPFFSYILMNMEIEKTKSAEYIPTMGVNQFGNLYWNEEFTKTLTDAQLEAVLAHEAMHIATLTFQRENNRDKMLWNMATDLVINQMLIDEQFDFPEGVLKPDSQGYFKFKDKNDKDVKLLIKDKNAEQVYDFLINHIKIIHVNFGQNGENGDGQPDGDYQGSFDKHIDADKDSQGKSQEKAKDEASFKANEENWKKKSIEASTAAKMRGQLSANLARELEGILEPKIDWRKKLYQFITKDIPVDFSMRRPGRRFYTTGIYYPTVIRENLEVICGCDNSGSISYGSQDSEGSQFISEGVGIAQAFSQIKMRFIWWDTSVNEKDDIVVGRDNYETLKTHKPTGGGGTNLSCFKSYCEEKGYRSRIYVILTDGYIESHPKLPDGKILFVLSKGGSDTIIKNYGEVCCLNDIEK